MIFTAQLNDFDKIETRISDSESYLVAPTAQRNFSIDIKKYMTRPSYITAWLSGQDIGAYVPLTITPFTLYSNIPPAFKVKVVFLGINPTPINLPPDSDLATVLCHVLVPDQGVPKWFYTSLSNGATRNIPQNGVQLTVVGRTDVLMGITIVDPSAATKPKAFSISGMVPISLVNGNFIVWRATITSLDKKISKTDFINVGLGITSAAFDLSNFVYRFIKGKPTGYYELFFYADRDPRPLYIQMDYPMVYGNRSLDVTNREMAALARIYSGLVQVETFSLESSDKEYKYTLVVNGDTISQGAQKI